MPAGETGGVWSGVAVWPAICAGIATIDCSINATKIRLTNGSLSSVVIVNFAMSIIEFARGVWSCFLTHLPRTFVPVVAGIGLSSAGWKQRWHRTLSQERSDACHSLRTPSHVHAHRHFVLHRDRQERRRVDFEIG